MGNKHYAGQSERYSFVKLPWVFFTEDRYKELSIRSKVLYGIFLSWMEMSDRNGWRDETGAVFIVYSVKRVQDVLNCGKNSAIDALSELEEYGLIERRKRGVGQTNIIYPLVFDSAEECERNFDKYGVDDENEDDFVESDEVYNSNLEGLKSKPTEFKNQTHGVYFSNPKYIDNKYNNLNIKKENNKKKKESLKTGFYSDDFEDLWKEYPRKKEKAKAYKAYRARINEGVSHDDLLKAVKLYADECSKDGTGEKFIKHCATFFSATKPYEDYLTNMDDVADEKPKDLDSAFEMYFAKYNGS